MEIHQAQAEAWAYLKSNNKDKSTDQSDAIWPQVYRLSLLNGSCWTAKA